MRRKILRLALFFSKCNLSHWCQPALLMILLGEQVLWMSDGIKEWNNNIFLYILMLSMGILLSMKMTMVSYHNSRRKIMRGNCHHWSFITVYYYHHYYYYFLSIYGDIISLYGCIIELSQWQQLRAVKCKQLLGKISSFSPSHFLTCDWNEFQKYFSIISSASVCKEKKSKKKFFVAKKAVKFIYQKLKRH